MRTALVLLALLATACGDVDIQFNPADEFAADGMRVLTETARDRECIAENLDRARKMVEAKTGVALATEGVTVWIHTTPEAMRERGILGHYDPMTDSIYLTASLESAAHEMLHRFEDVEHGDSGHEGWGRKGFDALDEQFKREVAHCGWAR